MEIALKLLTFNKTKYLFMKKYYIKTFGCVMNYSDSERIATFLESHDFEPLQERNVVDLSIKDLTKANLVVFNTCGVRQTAEDRVYGQIHNLRKDNPQIIIILTGCLAHRKDVQRRLKNKVDLFTQIKNCPKDIGNLFAKRKNDTIFTQNYFAIKPKYSSKFQALVPVMTGCDNFCSYCVVPYARGKEISRPTKEILEEIQKLTKGGCKEIMLLGQNVNSYKSQNPKVKSMGYDSKAKTTDFSALLKKINAIPGNFWIRFLTSHPKDMSDELIKTITKLEKVCEYVHLPIQAGDDDVLERMNRKYTSAHYLKLIEKIRDSFVKHKPKIQYAISTDIIVGFPGETKKQFRESAKIMQEVGYDMAYTAQFSPRPETVAWNMQDDIPKEEKVRREKELMAILKETSLRNNKKYVGKIMKVLVEKEKNGFYFGKTRTMKNVRIKNGQNKMIGKFINAEITKANIWNLEGAVVK